MVMHFEIDKSWQKVLQEEFGKQYFKELANFVENEYKLTTVFPEIKNVFRTFNLCSFDDVKVILLGQDPYHGEGQANGLCFSVNDGVKLPPSLKNIYKELVSDLGVPMPTNGNLDGWAQQGVLLLNATLTVRRAQPGSHQKQGWETFTDAVIKKLSDQKSNCVFILWGKYAQDKGKIIDQDKHCVLSAPHPSPFSVHSGFLGSKPFSKTNAYLKSVGKTPIAWEEVVIQGQLV